MDVKWVDRSERSSSSDSRSVDEEKKGGLGVLLLTDGHTALLTNFIFDLSRILESVIRLSSLSA